MSIKLSPIAFLCKTYFMLWSEYGRKPQPKTILDFFKHYENEAHPKQVLKIIEEKTLQELKTTGGLYNVGFEGFGTGISMPADNCIPLYRVTCTNNDIGVLIKTPKAEGAQNMSANFKNCDISENIVGVKSPSSKELNFEDSRITKNDIGVDIYITREDIVALGLPEHTDPELLKEAILMLKNHQDAPKEAKEYLLSTTRLFKWLGNISSITTIASAIIEYTLK